MTRDTIDNDFGHPDDDGYDDDEIEEECGLMSDGQCLMAGSEHCDFVCQNRNSELFAGSKAWREKHRKQR